VPIVTWHSLAVQDFLDFQLVPYKVLIYYISIEIIETSVFLVISPLKKRTCSWIGRLGEWHAPLTPALPVPLTDVSTTKGAPEKRYRAVADIIFHIKGVFCFSCILANIFSGWSPSSF
jgi:hypothetical protein